MDRPILLATEDPGAIFWEDYANTNRLCQLLDFIRVVTKPARFNSITHTLIEEKKVSFYGAVKYAGPKGRGIRIIKLPRSFQETYFYASPRYATMDNGNEVPWKNWTGIEDELDFHAYHVTIQGKHYTEAFLCKESMSESLINLVYGYGMQDYTLSHLHSLSVYEKIEYAKSVVDYNDELEDLIIA